MKWTHGLSVDNDRTTELRHLRRPVVFLSGATAVGKTQTVFDLSDKLNIRIISADAAQVFRGMDIGTAKPDRSVLDRYPHCLVDVRDPWQSYSAAEFCHDAYREIERAHADGVIPVLTGGTMFYFSALLNGLSDLPSADKETRNRIIRKAEKSGWEALHGELVSIDSELGAKLHSHDKQRIQRALEINYMTGRKPSSVMKECEPVPCPWPVLHLTLFHTDRRLLHSRIAQRFDEMLDKGLVEEVERLRRHPKISRESTAMKTVGYRQTWNWLEGDINNIEMRETTIAATRQLAKRQLTWLRHTAGVVWIPAGRLDTSSIVCDYIKIFTSCK